MKLKFYTRLTIVFAAILMFSYNATSQDTLTVQIIEDSDDAEEGSINGAMTNTSSDLELGEYDTWTQNDTAQGLQIIGLRFNDITIPKSSTILTASIQFTADNTGADSVQLTIYGENVANPETFKDENLDSADHFFNISTRTRTVENAVWDVPEWVTTGDAGDAQKTVDLASIVQAIVNRDDWASGNSIAFIMEHSGPSIGVTSSSGGREAEAGPGSDAATLTITYNPYGTGNNPIRAESSNLIYPNPTMDGVLYINNPTSDRFSYRVRSITGQLLQQQDQISGSRATVHMTESGIYIVEIMCADKVYTQKVIVK